MNLFATLITTIALTLSAAGMVQAQSLRVAPTSVEIIAPGATATITVRNVGRQPMTIQSRVFAWSSGGATDVLANTRDVVISPPITQLAPGSVQTLRIVRTSKKPIRSEESYRLFVDELPTKARKGQSGVDFVTRLRIPVFLTPQNAVAKSLQWRVRSSGGRSYLEAQNAGDVRVRISDLHVTAGSRRVISNQGLAGYVLSKSTARWPLPKGAQAGMSLRAASNFGPISATVR